MKSSHKILTIAGASALIFLVLKSKKNHESKTSAHGIVLTENGPEIEDWNAWMDWGPRAMREAMDDGAQNGQQILSHCMRRLFPDKIWPPSPQSPFAEKWRTLVRGMDKAIQSTDAQDEEFANVIQFPAG